MASVRVTVPPLSETADEYVLTRWLKRPGDPVNKGEPLYEVETDKTIVQVEAPVSGRLQEVLVGDGQPVRSGQEVGVVES